MIREVKDENILSAELEAIVNPVNCYGVARKGLAYDFKVNYRESFLNYRRACREKRLRIGKVFLDRVSLFNPQCLIYFPTKLHWRHASQLEYIEKGLEDLVSVILEHEIQSVGIPKLGCGLGGLAWEDVRRLLYENLAVLSHVDCVLYV